MTTQFNTSSDGKQIAYDLSRARPAIVLLHGCVSRREWQAAGYVQRLQNDFTVITLDLRGHGKSDLPTDPSDCTISKLHQDILAVADSCGAGRFHLWGMSYGAKVGRYLAATSSQLKNDPDGHAIRPRCRRPVAPGCHRVLCPLAPDFAGSPK